jgi:hypothetical protein
MNSSASLGGQADVGYTGDLSLTAGNLQYSSPQTTTTTQITTTTESTSYTLNLKPGVNGTTNPPPQNYTRAAGTSLEVTGLPDPNCSLGFWILDGRDVGDANPYLVTFDGNHVLQPVFGPASEGQSGRNVVVDPNNWAEYTTRVDTGGQGLPDDLAELASVESVRGTVVGVTGSVATISVDAKFSNGTVRNLGEFTTDADSGFTSNSVFGAFIIGSGLGPNDQVFTSSLYSLPNAVINETTPWTQNGFNRMAVHLKSDAFGEYFWDQGTGLLLYALVPIFSGNQAVPMGYIKYTLTSTSLFSGGSGSTLGPASFLLSAFWIGVIIAVVAIMVAVAAIVRMKSRRHGKDNAPPEAFSKKQAKKEHQERVMPPGPSAAPGTGAPVAKFTFCPNCGRTLPSHVTSKFCPFCGFSLSE